MAEDLMARQVREMALHLFVWGTVAHLVGDWLLQNHWIAAHKHDVWHGAAWVHGGIHGMLLLPLFPLWHACFLMILHMTIDTRVPLDRWRRVFRQTTEGEIALHVAIWGDQALHFFTLAGMAWFTAVCVVFDLPR